MIRYPYRIAESEMERRHKATLAEMQAQGIDCLILQNNSGWLGGAMKYLTEVNVTSYSMHAIFSKDGLAVFGHGPAGGTVKPPHLDLPYVTEQHSQPLVISMTYSDLWIPGDMLAYIKKHNFKKIGWVGMAYITANVYKHLTENLPGCEFVNASEITDHLRAVKSEYELGLYAQCVDVHDKVAAAVPAVLRPGRTEYEVVTELHYICRGLGCPEINIMIGSHPTHPTINPYLYTHKKIEKSDCVGILLELCCAHYTWGEVARVYTFQQPSQALKDACDYGIYLQDYIAGKAVPGASPKDIFNDMNVKLEAKGYKKEARLAIHGQSCDIVDRPIFDAAETMLLEENMFFASHPTCSNGETWVFNCDNYVVKKGGAVRLNKTPRGLVVLD